MSYKLILCHILWIYKLSRYCMYISHPFLINFYFRCRMTFFFFFLGSAYAAYDPVFLSLLWRLPFEVFSFLFVHPLPLSLSASTARGVYHTKIDWIKSPLFNKKSVFFASGRDSPENYSFVNIKSRGPTNKPLAKKKLYAQKGFCAVRRGGLPIAPAIVIIVYYWRVHTIFGRRKKFAKMDQQTKSTMGNSIIGGWCFRGKVWQARKKNICRGYSEQK